MDNEHIIEEDISIEEMDEVSGAGCAGTAGTASCPASIGTAACW
ncbi:thiocillin family RiPP [Streptomyces sp. NPDC052301]